MALINSDVIPAGVTTPYTIDQSLRFNNDDSAYLSWTPSSAGNRRTWTWSAWVKRGNLSTEQVIFSAGTSGTDVGQVRFNSDNTIKFLNYTGGFQWNLTTNALYRDVSSWYHIVVTADTSNATSGDRVKLYVNGERVTSFSTETYPSQNYEGNINSTDQHNLARYTGVGTSFLDGYQAEVNFIDGQALDPTYFGETGDYGEWKPIEYTGTYGTNGFYLDFAGEDDGIIDASGNTTVTANNGVAHSTTRSKFGNSSILFTGGGNGNADFGYGISYAGNSNNCPNGSNDITWEAWVYFPSGTNNQTLWHGHQFDWYVPLFSINSSNKLEFLNQSNGGSNLIATTANTTVPNDQWVHVAITISNKTVKIWQNGSQVANYTYTTGTWTVPSGQQMIGAGFTSHMDEIRVSNNIRYSSTFTPPTTTFTSDSNTQVLIHSDINEGISDDKSGNTNNWTKNNITFDDQVLDSPTNNFATMSPLTLEDLQYSGTWTFSEGNLKASGSSSRAKIGYSFAPLKSGKYYMEVRVNNNDKGAFGWMSSDSYHNNHGNTGGHWWHTYDDYIQRDSDETGSGSNYISPASINSGDIGGIAIDLDGNSITWYKNGTSLGSGTLYLTDYVFYMSDFSDSGSNTPNYTVNFGQDSTFAGVVTAGGNSDANGIGDFKYSVPSGYLALCTANLPDPAVIPSENFNTVTWTGNATERTIDVGFQPDFIWAKTRSNASSHNLVDAVRGVKKLLSTNATDQEYTESDTAGIDAFTSNGFSLEDATFYEDVNQSSRTYVAWNWKANGSGVSNTNGDITSTVSANQDAGFSIVSYSGATNATSDTSNNGGSYWTIGHGLTKAPELIIVKKRSGAASWYVTSDYIGGSTPWADGKHCVLDGNSAVANESPDGILWGNTAPTSSVFTVGGWDVVNRNGSTYISYCFHSVDGFSKVGSYTGNGSTDGKFVYTGFRPAFIMVKSTTSAHDWVMEDNTRSIYNPVNEYVIANGSQTESSDLYNHTDFLSNGFKLRDTQNGMNGSNTYIYIAFAEVPAKFSNGR